MEIATNEFGNFAPGRLVLTMMQAVLHHAFHTMHRAEKRGFG
jgi:hypothetical protein